MRIGIIIIKILYIYHFLYEVVCIYLKMTISLIYILFRNTLE